MKERSSTTVEVLFPLHRKRTSHSPLPLVAGTSLLKNCVASQCFKNDRTNFFSYIEDYTKPKSLPQGSTSNPEDDSLNDSREVDQEVDHFERSHPLQQTLKACHSYLTYSFANAQWLTKLANKLYNDS